MYIFSGTLDPQSFVPHFLCFVWASATFVWILAVATAKIRKLWVITSAKASGWQTVGGPNVIDFQVPHERQCAVFGHADCECCRMVSTAVPTTPTQTVTTEIMQCCGGQVDRGTLRFERHVLSAKMMIVAASRGCAGVQGGPFWSAGSFANKDCKALGRALEANQTLTSFTVSGVLCRAMVQSFMAYSILLGSHFFVCRG